MPWWPEARNAESQLLVDFEHSDSLGSCELAVLVWNYPVLLFNKVSFMPRYSDPTHLRYVSVFLTSPTFLVLVKVRVWGVAYLATPITRWVCGLRWFHIRVASDLFPHTVGSNRQSHSLTSAVW